jgi:capsular polysaccharide biosynthesis protein
MRKLNDDEVTIQDLERATTIAQNNFYHYAEDLEHARVDEELDRLHITNVVEAQAATLAEKPISPSKMLVLVLAMLLATAGTASLVLACEKFDSRIHSEEQVESVLRLPVLAAVPEGRMYATAGGASK